MNSNYAYSPIPNRNDVLRNTRSDSKSKGMGGKLDKFLLLMWKNWLLQYRRPVQTIIEILAPVIFSILLVLIRGIVTIENFPHTNFTAFDIVNFAQAGSSVNTNLSLLFSPDINFTQTIVSQCDTYNVNCIIFDGSNSLEEYYSSNSASIFAAVQFDDNINETDLNYLKNADVNIRFPSELRVNDDDWKTNLLYPLYQVPGPRSYNSNYGGTPRYYQEGFLTVQYIISSGIYLYTGGSLTDLTVHVQMERFKYGEWQNDVLLEALPNMIGLLMLLSYIYTCINTVKSITIEKERQLKEAMKIMGLDNWLHWCAWFVKTFVLLLISNILIVIFMKVNWYPNSDYTIFTFSDPSVVLVFLLLYSCATVTFCFAISVFFSKANTAGTLAGLAWFLSYAPYLFMQQNYDSASLSSKLLGSLGANSALGYGFQVIIMYEGTQEGVQWSNIGQSNSVDDNLSLALLMLMLIIDTFLYLFIALYVEAVFPGEYGVPQPWYYLFTSSYWCGNSRSIGIEDSSPLNLQKSEFFEDEPKNLHAGIQIQELRKVFNKNKVAVSGLSLNMYENQITVLLGHNGAGKTTTMSMLTGMFPPSNGTALVNGYDIRTNMDNVRSSLGLCPQHNILFDDLTVKEHLYFYSKLKGLEKKEIDNEITKYVEMLELVPKTDARSSTLSGGMKRKLCVGIALCGNSKVVMLDEPTAGMDPSARRALWDLLLNQKKDRTMLLSTHFMDEADLLGDRIAIMSGGQLQCCGSSFFLKKKYGAGYHLVMDKARDCDIVKVTQLLRKYIPTVEIESNIGSELTYQLPETQVSFFEFMLRDLETNSKNLGINSYGISLTTLEEVFMKVGADHSQEEEKNNRNGIIENGNSDENSAAISLGQSQLLTGTPLLLNQIKSMCMKKYLATIRTYILHLIQFFMPIVFLIIAIVVNNATQSELPELKLTLDKYSNPKTLVAGSNTNIAMNRYLLNLDSLGYEYETRTDEDSLRDRMVELSEESPSTLRREYLIAASFNDVNATAWFNNDPLHTPGLALSHLINALYDLNLTFINKPFPFTIESKIKQISSGQSMGFQIAFNIGFSMAFVSSFYVLFYVRERVSKSKHLQFVSGARVYLFWLVSYIADMITFIITSLGVIITLVCFQEDGFKTADDLGRMFAILLYFGFCMIPMMYLASYLFDVPSSGYSRMSLFSIFLGNAAFMVVTILKTPGLDLEDIGNGLHWFFLLVPHYSMITGISESFTLYSYNQVCELSRENGLTNVSLTDGLTCDDIDEEYFRWAAPGIGRNVCYSIIMGVIFLIALLLVDYKIFTRIIHNIKSALNKTPPTAPPSEQDDDDVLNEKLLIRNTSEYDLHKNYTLVLRDVTKYYKNFLAVNSMCLGVKNYECFGLLGVNGAGKTTTFKMMTGDEDITYGDAWVNGYSLRSNLKQVQRYIGYCPQFDALLDDLTARESLIMFSLLRGVHSQDIPHLVNKLSSDFDFKRHLDKQVKELSGGNKRKLSTAIALIGDPPVIYLDEPTTGMDVATKRYLWNALCQVRDNGKCIVLTSHSMEECEALCTRLAIMVNGNFKCLGSTQHLKDKFAQSYSLMVKVKKYENRITDTAPIEQFIQTNFQNVELREKHQEFLSYYINNRSLTWSQMFGIMEKGKNSNLHIEDYSLGQSSLEQVFLTFTKFQNTIEE